MRILIFTSAGNKSGGSRQALYLAQGLHERGHEVRFFTVPHAGLRSLAPDAPFWRDLVPGAWGASLDAELPAEGPCVVHAFHNKAVKFAAWWGMFRRRVAVAAHRGVLFRPKNPLPYWSPGVDGFLVNSRACVRVIRTWGVSKKRLFYVPNSVPDERIAPTAPRETLRAAFGCPPNDFVFGCVGGDNPNKGAEVLLKAFALAFGAQSAGPKLLLSGLGYQAPFALHRELGLSDNVRLEGPTEAVADRLAVMDAFILPSLSESMPNTLLEAVRFGLPAVGSAVGAVPEVLETCGLIVPPGNVEALAQAMRRMHEDTALFTRLRDAAGPAGEAYSPQKRLDLVESIYAELLRRKGLI